MNKEVNPISDEDKKQADDVKNQGNDEFKKGNFTRAIELYGKAISLNPNEASYYSNRAACYHKMKKYYKCIEDAEQAVRIDPNFTKGMRRKALALLAIGNIREAKMVLENIIKIDPSDKTVAQDIKDANLAESYFKQMEENINNKNYVAAQRYLTQLSSMYPDFEALHFKRVELLAKQNKSGEAVKVSGELMNDYQNNSDFLYVRALAVFYHGQTELAKKTLTKALQMDPDNAKCMQFKKKINKFDDFKEKANEAFKQGNYDEAIKFYTDCLELDPDHKSYNSVILTNRATANLKLKKYTEAIADCDKSIELNEENAKAHVRKGEIKMAMEDFEDAARDFKKAHQIDSQYPGIREKVRDADQAAKKAARKDYYKILEIEKTATEDEIKKAYKKLARKWHPDKNKESEEAEKAADKKFKDISEAYTVLSDPQKRQRFDSGVDLDDPYGGMGGGDPFGGMGGMGGMDPFSFFMGNMGGGMGGHSHGGGRTRGGNPFASQGGNPFGGGGGMPGGFTFKFSQG